FESVDAERREAKEALNEKDNFIWPAVGKGFTKSRANKYAAPISLDFRSLRVGLDAELRFIHLAPVVKGVARMVLDKDFGAVLNGFDRTITSNMIVPWLQRTAEQRTEGRSGTGEGWKFVDGASRYIRQ